MMNQTPKKFLLFLALAISLHCRLHLRHLSAHRHEQSPHHADLDDATVEHTATHYTINSASRVVTTLNVPDVFQATDYTCGPASLTAALNYFHIDQREADLARMAKTNE
jgi:hypothetical protein